MSKSIYNKIIILISILLVLTGINMYYQYQYQININNQITQYQCQINKQQKEINIIRETISEMLYYQHSVNMTYGRTLEQILIRAK